MSHAEPAAVLAEVAPLPLDEDGPVFEEPWQAQAFAMALALHERGVFTWPEWAAALAEQIASDPATPYYHHWLATIETLVSAKSVASSTELAERRDDWERAAHATPHGQPITLA